MERITSLGICEYGVQNGLLAQNWKRLKTDAHVHRKPVRLVVSLDNSDRERVLLQILKTDADRVLQGMHLTAAILEAEESFLFLPEADAKLREMLEGLPASAGIQIRNNDFVDRRLFPGSAFHHIVTMAVLSDIVSDTYKSGDYAAVRENGKLGTIAWVPSGTRIGDLIQTPPSQIKGMMIGTDLSDKTALDTITGPLLSLGNGVITILEQSTCIVDEAEKQLEQSNILSCGKCTFCREGLLQLHGFVKDITRGKGKADMLPLMKEIGEAVPQGSLCDIGKTGAAFLVKSLSAFDTEYDDHIRKKRCPSAVCTAFVPIYIDPELCTGCEDCVDSCPVSCIEGKAGYIHMIDDLDCTKCGKCIERCDEHAIKKGAGRVPKLPERLTKCGKFKRH